MNLPHGGGRKILPAELVEEAAAILFHPLTPIGCGEPQVEPCARGLAEPSPPRAECMHQPGQFAELNRFKPAETAL
jgi:hypothetical protein